MGNSFNCLPIIDYIGGRALDLESRNLNTWLQLSWVTLGHVTYSLKPKVLQLYYNGTQIFTIYLTELW